MVLAAISSKVISTWMETDDEANEELKDFYGPLCLQAFEADPGGFKNLMWHEVMMEFDCKATSTLVKL